MTKEKIGFIGVGFMGHGMAKNIIEAGYPLTIMGHRNRVPVEELIGRGATEAKTPKALAEASDIVFLCVTGSDQVVAVTQGEDGLAAAGKALIIVDCSTSDPSVTTKLAASLAAQNITLLDAPLGRTPKDAWEGTLDVMIGGDADDIARVRPIIETFSQRMIHTGPTGTGHTMKLLNNFLSLGYGALYAEALMLGEKSGLSAETFHSVITGGRMDCGFYQTYMNYVVGRDRNAHKFTLSNALKDTSYLNAFAQAQGAANPIAAAVRNSYALAIGTGHGDDFVPMLSDIIAELNGLPPKS
ncbi:MAG: NAD(P)-dependent oxidoreductase [Acidiphilium sp.]|uniref:NAD(P)-dependent oxidoreductase n=1 Tax=Acidiphilium acidophilum TaxID=76588 RepID=A0AAW9DR88_ACIAO|nr:NAD(P)-dependent oxidoreductase [Acidiphilium acidophilum]MDD2860520.1 NAD(P)-dependent oxidoreductase [Acidiphilium sp.]MDX5931724.1 NAD(P)-dependent oxidoreductase [Acidiphilium acidophilum]